jgi:L-threonylcarbamoyladenylate synthase
MDANRPGSLEAAAARLAVGELIILPTDTVYGVAADIRSETAVRALYDAKGKGAEAPLQLLVADRAMAEAFADLSGPAGTLIDDLGPGGWTVIAPARTGWSSPALAGGTTVGIRIPDAAAPRAIARLLGAPLAASSANRHGSPSPRTCAESVGELGDAVAIALDGGEVGGIDSTVIDCATTPPRILREGAIDRATVARILGLQSIEVLRSVRP